MSEEPNHGRLEEKQGKKRAVQRGHVYADWRGYFYRSSV